VPRKKSEVDGGIICCTGVKIRKNGSRLKVRCNQDSLNLRKGIKTVQYPLRKELVNMSRNYPHPQHIEGLSSVVDWPCPDEPPKPKYSHLEASVAADAAAVAAILSFIPVFKLAYIVCFFYVLFTEHNKPVATYILGPAYMAACIAFIVVCLLLLLITIVEFFNMFSKW